MKHHRHRTVGYDPSRDKRRYVPSEALTLNEDIANIELAVRLLASVSECNITKYDNEKDREFARVMKGVTLSQIKSWKQYATIKLRNQYLK